MRSNIHKLVYSTHSAENGPVTNRNMSCYLCVIAHDAVVAYNAIMCKVAICHYKAIAPDHGLLPDLCSPVDRYIFADGCIISNANDRIFALEFHILRNRGDDSPWKNATIFSNARAFHDRHVRTNPCPLPNFNVLVNDGKWIHLYIRCQPGIRMNISMRVNH